ncbi:hypothetical protein [Alkaliphilus crotonatoxidans]
MEKRKYLLALFLFLPWVVGMTINLLITYSLATNHPLPVNVGQWILSLWKYVAVISWIWVGNQFACLKIEGKKAFLLGNGLWGISLMLYIWRFYLTDNVSISNYFAGLSQHYPLGFLPWASLLIRIFSDTIYSNHAILLAYGLMLIVFAFGYYKQPFSRISKRSSEVYRD